MATAGGYCRPGGYTGWVLGVGIPGEYPASPLLRGGSQKHPAKRAPEAPQGLEWVGCGTRGLQGVRRRGRALYPPYGPGRSPLGPSLVQDPRNAASGPIRARFRLFLSKVSQNGIVSPEKW